MLGRRRRPGAPHRGPRAHRSVQLGPRPERVGPWSHGRQDCRLRERDGPTLGSGLALALDARENGDQEYRYRYRGRYRWSVAARPGVDWQVQFAGTLDTSVAAQVYDVDGAGTSAATVARLHAAGRKVICYVDVGSSESYRADFARLPASVLGSVMDGWPDERWLDIRQLSVISPVMAARFDECRAKGFDAVDPDNVDGYTNDTGFPLTAADQLAFNRAIAALAHERGLAVGLKNDVDQLAALAPSFDFAVNEQCVAYSECAGYRAFTGAGKPVYSIEYTGTPATVCAAARRYGLTTLIKDLALDAVRHAC